MLLSLNVKQYSICRRYPVQGKPCFRWNLKAVKADVLLLVVVHQRSTSLKRSHLPQSLDSCAPPLLGKVVDLLQLFPLVFTQRRCERLIPACIWTLNTCNRRGCQLLVLHLWTTVEHQFMFFLQRENMHAIIMTKLIILFIHFLMPHQGYFHGDLWINYSRYRITKLIKERHRILFILTMNLPKTGPFPINYIKKIIKIV